jgi:hypothetical protein
VAKVLLRVEASDVEVALMPDLIETSTAHVVEDSNLCVVHIHMGSRLPGYFWETVEQTRRFHSGLIVCVLPPNELRADLVKRLDLTVVPNDSFDDEVLVRSVNNVSWLDQRYGGGGFWHFTLLRLFVLEAVMRRYGFDSCLHLENDVLIYHPLPSVWPALVRSYGFRCAVAPLGPTSGCTAAIMYVGSTGVLTEICQSMLSELQRDESEILAMLGADMVNEMVLLGVVRLLRPELLDVLPVSPFSPNFYPSVKRVFKPWARPFLRLADWIHPKLLKRTPAENLTSHLPTIGVLFDPAFWGQYAGGTPHGEGPGFSAPHHWIGNDLRKGRYALVWGSDEAGRRVPHVECVDTHYRWPLFNLHIHCKRIAEFV